MNALHNLFLAASLVCCSNSVAFAQDFYKGNDAYQAGDYKAAFEEWLSNKVTRMRKSA